MGSMSRGFRLAKASWSVVRRDRELLILPVISFFCSLAVAAVFVLGAFGIGIPSQGQTASPLLYALGFCFYVALSFVTIFFNAAVIATAMKRLKGEPASISDGIAAAKAHLGQIFVWAVITATVGMILRAIQERSGLIGRILAGIVGVAWNVITFFVVPVLLFENVGAIEGVKRSASLFRQRWGEQFTGNATISIAIILIAIPVVIVGGLIAAAVPIVGIPLLVIAIGGLIAIGAACTGVFNAALYRYATTGEASGAFTIQDMNDSFRPKKGRRGLFGGSSGAPPAPGGFAGGSTWTAPAPGSEAPPARPDRS